ncbi:MAG: MarR family winged helix-turn-helix transcriptional regulator [Culicoidibacterales bacterium]
MEQAFINFMKAMDLDEFNTIKNSDLGEQLSYSNIVLIYIINHYEQVTASELAKHLNVSKPAITQKINELEKLGMVVKTRSQTDKRIVYLSLSDQLKQTASQAKMATVIDVVDQHFSAEKKAIFEEILTFMTAYILGDS